MDVIYADELLALNGLVDYLLLLSAARLRGIPLRRGRFALAAAAGGLYALAAALPPLGWLQGWVWKLAVSLLMSLLAYGRTALWKNWACFLGLSCAFAGAVFAASLLAGQPSREGFLPVSSRILLLSFGVCYAAVRLLFGRLLRRRAREVVRVEVSLGRRSAAFAALRDTGNGLWDPLTGSGVLVADTAALAPLFPPELSLPTDPSERFRSLSALPELRDRLRLIPFSAVGTERGLLVCFRPDLVRVAGEPLALLVGLSPTALGEAEYAAVV